MEISIQIHAPRVDEARRQGSSVSTGTQSGATTTGSTASVTTANAAATTSSSSSSAGAGSCVLDTPATLDSCTLQ